MARTITIDGAQLHEVRIVTTPTGETAIQLSYNLLSGTAVVRQVSLDDITARLKSSEMGMAKGLLTAMEAALARLEL